MIWRKNTQKARVSRRGTVCAVCVGVAHRKTGRIGGVGEVATMTFDLSVLGLSLAVVIPEAVAVIGMVELGMVVIWLTWLRWRR